MLRLLGIALMAIASTAVRAEAQRVVDLLTAKHCDSGCQDDGGWGFSLPYAVAAAGVGAAVGGVLGAIVDLSRSDIAVGPGSRE